MLIGIYTSQRCGSNLCESLLHKYGVKPFGEQYCFKEEGGLIRGKHKKTDQPVTHLTNLMSCSPDGNYSVRVMTSHFKHYNVADAHEKMLSVGNMCDNIIILKREFFYKYTSQKIADITGHWVSFGSKGSGVMGIGDKFSKLFRRKKQEWIKPVFEPEKYNRWEKTYDERFDAMNRMFPNAHNITYRGIIDSDMDIKYILPEQWNVETALDTTVQLPTKQVSNNKTGSDPWKLYQNSEVAKEYFVRAD